MMKRTFIALAMIFLCIEMHSQENSYPRITFGAEWGYIGVIYSGYHYNFIAPEGYRVDPRGWGFTYDSNGEAYLHMGYNLNDKYNLSLYAGISAVMDYHHTVPVSLRLTRYFGDSHLKDRWLTFIDLGSGIIIRQDPQELLTGKIGGGYRLSLSRDTKLDLLMSVRTVLTHPDIDYYGTMITPDRINRNNAYCSAISLGMALTF